MGFNIFENHNLDFEVSLIKLNRKREGDDVTDVIEDTIAIEQSAILNLEINESSLSMGATGTITINNLGNFFERFKITTNSPNDLYVAISIKDVELDGVEVPETEKVIKVVGLVNSTAAGSKDIIDNIVIFKFEEAFVAATRKTSLRYFFRNNFISSSDSQDVLSLAEAFNANVYKLKSSDSIIAGDSDVPNVQHDIKTTEDVKLKDSTDNTSVYDALNIMLKESTIGEHASGERTAGRIPYFRFVNTIEGDQVVRKLKFAPFISDKHIELMSTVLSKGEGDFSSVYLEKFSTGPDTEINPLDPNTSMYNKLEQYNITRADSGQLREKVWGDYMYMNSLPTADFAHVEQNKKYFSEIISDFHNVDLNGQDVGLNIPLLDRSETRIFPVFYNTLSTNHSAEEAGIQQINLVANTVIRSFLTINETISFTSKGNVIRQPNKFIWIERDTDYEEEDIQKLWYVNSVTHKFKDGKYTTDVIATKLFGDTSAADVAAAITADGRFDRSQAVKDVQRFLDSLQDNFIEPQGPPSPEEQAHNQRVDDLFLGKEEEPQRVGPPAEVDVIQRPVTLGPGTSTTSNNREDVPNFYPTFGSSEDTTSIVYNTKLNRQRGEAESDAARIAQRQEAAATVRDLDEFITGGQLNAQRSGESPAPERAAGNPSSNNDNGGRMDMSDLFLNLK